MEQKHVERVDVIVSRLLEVASVVAHLRLHLFFDNAGCFLFPFRRAGKIGNKRSQCVQRDGLAQQVSIGGKVKREIVLDVQAVTI